MSPARLALIQRIKKLMALATSSNANEAAAAMAKAQALMDEHNVTDLDLVVIAERESQAQAAQRPPLWQVLLSQKCCEAFGVHRHLGYSQKDARVVWIFVGPDHRVEIAGYAYDVLARLCRSATRKFMAKVTSRSPKKRARMGDDYAWGFIQVAVRQLAKIAPPSEREGAALQQYLQSKELVDAKAKNLGGKPTMATAIGAMDGQSAQLHHGTTGTQRHALGGTPLALEATA